MPAVQRPRGAPYRRSVDWEHVALVGTGLLIGAALGVGATLLFAPGSGLETRSAIRRFTSLFEPLIILVMGLLIGTLILSLMLAITSINDIAG